MFKNSIFIFFTSIYYVLMATTYIIVSTYVNHLNADDKDTRYLAFILITFFFGSVTKTLYSFFVDIHVDFIDELPYLYKKTKKIIYGITDLLLVFLMMVFILQITNNAIIILYTILFGIVIFALFLYMIFNHKKIHGINKSNRQKKNNKNVISTSNLDVEKEDKNNE